MALFCLATDDPLPWVRAQVLTVLVDARSTSDRLVPNPAATFEADMGGWRMHDGKDVYGKSMQSITTDNS